MEYNTFMLGAELIYLIGMMPNIFAILKNRDKLRGFSICGGVLSIIAMSLYIIAFYHLNWHLNILMTIPSLLFWFSVIYYNVKFKNT